MDKALFKKYILIATYTVVLFLVLSHLNVVASSLGYICNVAKPIIIGACIMFVMNVLLKFYEKHFFKHCFENKKNGQKKKRGICVLLTYAPFALFITVLSLVVVPQVAQSVRTLAEHLPAYLKAASENITAFLQQMGFSDDLGEIIQRFMSQLEISLSDVVKNVAGAVLDVTVNVAKAVFNFFLGLIIAAYMLFAKEKLVKIAKKLCYAIFKQKAAETINDIAAEANVTFSRFIGGQVLSAIILGCLCFIGMLIIGIPYAPLISCIVGVASIIPVLGPFIGAIPSAFIILMEDPVKALVFLIFILVLQQFKGNLIYPKIVGTAVGLDGLWVIAAVIIGGGIGGAMGMLVGVPLMAVIYSLVKVYAEKSVKKRGIEIWKYDDAQSPQAAADGEMPPPDTDADGNAEASPPIDGGGEEEPPKNE